MKHEPEPLFLKTCRYLTIALFFSVSLLSLIVLPRVTGAQWTTITLNEAVQAATRDQFPVLTNTSLFISPIAQIKTWAFGTIGIVPAEGSAVDPQIMLFLAEQHVGGWSVALEHTSLFRMALTRSPNELLSTEQRAAMETPIQVQGNGSMQLSLPWATGETWSLTNGPHVHAQAYQRLAALDFAVVGRGNVRAAREGVVYAQCGVNSDFLRIDHGIAKLHWL